jgi:hypothetical protein
LKEELAVISVIANSATTQHFPTVAKNATVQNHLQNSTVANFATVQQEGNRQVMREIEYYGLDVILSVGYRVKSNQGIMFRAWANTVLKDYILKGYAINQRFERLEYRMTETEKKVDVFVRTALPPVEGIFYDGQILEAYAFVSDLIKSAKKSIMLIDNYIDETVLLQLSKRNKNVSAEIYTAKISDTLQLDIEKHNTEYQPITVKATSKFHDRFLIIDDTAYNIGASLKDLGKKLFAFNKMEVKTNDLLKNIK